MKIATLSIAIAIWVTAVFTAAAQEKNEETLQILEQTKEKVTQEEKDALKVEVEAILEQQERNIITVEEAELRKKKAAEKHALNIENRLAIINNKIELLQRNGTDTSLDDDDRLVLSVGWGDRGDSPFVFLGPKNRQRPYDRRTTSDFVLAIGFNNVITEGQSLEDSPYKLAGSRFAELGWAWKTRVFQESNWLRIKYGISFQFNGLKPEDNQYLVDTGSETELQTYPIDLDKSKFRLDNLVVPIHFEFGPSKKIEGENYFRYDTHNQIKVGIGGYAGIKLAARQKLKYEVDGEDIKEKQKGSFNTNNFIYGVSAYLGWRDTALYVKYDLNTIFKDNPVEQRNISLGLRFDMD
tara:strand:+ start:736 stop:1794 length:1059 start_codon:yes stop_codon:yes gene_type:complete